MKNVEKVADRVISKLGVVSAPVDVEKIAEYYNVQVRRAPAEEGLSGLLYRKDGMAFIAINSEEPSVRQRFTVAHELGHFFLHPARETFIEYRDKRKSNAKGFKEIEANSFAAALLMPVSLLKKDISDHEHSLSEDDVKVLANKYDVSEIAMTRRLTYLSWFK